MADEKKVQGWGDEGRFPDFDKLPKLGWAPEGKTEPLPEGMEPVAFLPGQLNPAPKILWGERFEPLTAEGEPNPKCMPIEWQAERYRKVAEAMNHAAAHSQNLLRQTCDIAEHQEQLLRQWQQRDIEMHEMIQNMTNTSNDLEQARTDEILQLRAYVRAARKDAAHYAVLAAKNGLVDDLDVQLSWGGKTLAERIEEKETA